MDTQLGMGIGGGLAFEDPLVVPFRSGILALLEAACVRAAQRVLVLGCHLLFHRSHARRLGILRRPCAWHDISRIVWHYVLDERRAALAGDQRRRGMSHRGSSSGCADPWPRCSHFLDRGSELVVHVELRREPSSLHVGGVGDGDTRPRVLDGTRVHLGANGREIPCMRLPHRGQAEDQGLPPNVAVRCVGALPQQHVVLTDLRPFVG
mmetsp:Transcript_176/g.648  ORF Transcript_176/g.648 Transcript_176/m.648 type:complete len:208 (+) Transcript_176:513-1136(+)